MTAHNIMNIDEIKVDKMIWKLKMYISVSSSETNLCCTKKFVILIESLLYIKSPKNKNTSLLMCFILQEIYFKINKLDVSVGKECLSVANI